MIDLSHEKLIPLREVPKHLPPRPNDKHLHISAVYRWMLHGVRGQRLETIKLGGTTYTSEEALQRFGEHLSSRMLPPTSPPMATPKARQRQIDRAAREVQRILGSGAHEASTSQPGRG